MSIDSFPDPSYPLFTRIPYTAVVDCGTGSTGAWMDQGRGFLIRQSGDSFAFLSNTRLDTFFVARLSGDNLLVGRMADPSYPGGEARATRRRSGVDPNRAAYRLQLQPEYLDAEVGDSARMTAAAYDAYLEPIQNPLVRWSSSAPGVATIRDDGVVTGVMPGVTTITGTIDTLVRSAQFTVLQPPASMAIVSAPDSLIDPDTFYVGAIARDGAGQPLSGRRFHWTSSNPAVAAVSEVGENGAVLTTGAGTVTITARNAGLSASVAFPVLPGVALIDVDGVPPDNAITIGSTAQLTAIPRDAGGNSLSGRPASWTADAFLGSIAVSPTGLVTAHRGGRGTVIVQVGDSSRRLDLTAVMDGRFTSLAAGDGHTCGITVTGRIYCWGNAVEGRLGPVTESGPGALPLPIAEPSVALEAGPSHSCALNASGAAFCWGRDELGQLGGPSGAVGEVHTVPGGHAFTGITIGDQFTCGVTAAHDAFCWGRNELGELGRGTASEGANATPALVAGSHAFSEVAAGSSHACGLTTAGQAWCWGSNFAGALGIGTTDDMAHPTPVHAAPGLTFSALAAGGSRVCGITSGGDVTCWGSFNPSPTEVPGVSGIVRLTGGDPGFCGLDAEGMMSCWDQPPLTAEFTPSVPIAQASASAHHICVLPVSGKAVCWGSNDVFQLGVEDQSIAYAPVEISGQP